MKTQSQGRSNSASNVIQFPTSERIINIPRLSNMTNDKSLGFHDITFNKFHFMAGDKIIVSDNFSLAEIKADTFVIAENKLTIASLVNDKSQITGLVKAFIREVN